MNRHFLLALICLLVAPPAAGALVEVPHPPLDDYKPDIRALLTGARERFESVAPDAAGEQLGVAYGRLGVHYYAHAAQDAARACFRNAASLDPDNFRWPYYLGVQNAETGSFGQAVDQFERVLALAPGDIPAATRLGLALLELNRIDEAEKQFAAVVDVQPANAPALAGLARVAEERGDWSAAAQRYTEALKSQPEASQLHYRLGLVYRHLGDLDQAAAHLGQNGPRIPVIDDPLLRLMNAHVRPAGYYVAIGDRMLAEGQNDRAWNAYDLARAVDPANDVAVAGMARVLFLNGNPEQAHLAADHALRLRPDSVPALAIKGLLEENDGRLAEAAALYEKAIAAGAQAQTRFRLANLLMRLSRFSAASGHFDALAGNDTFAIEANYRAGMAYIAAGDCTTAEQRLLTAYAASPGTGKVIQALARVYATCVEADEARLATAIGYAKMLYDNVPSLETSETLAMTLAANGDFDDAVDFQTQAIFEALKSGSMEMQSQLAANMERYRNQKPAVLPWPAGHAVFSMQDTTPEN